MDQEHASSTPSFGLENIGLDLADAGPEALHACRTQMKACALCKPPMIRAAMARKTWSAKRAECASSGDLGRTVLVATPGRAVLMRAAKASSAADSPTDRTFMDRTPTCKHTACSARVYSQLPFDPTPARPWAGSVQTLNWVTSNRASLATTTGLFLDPVLLPLLMRALLWRETQGAARGWLISTWRRAWRSFWRRAGMARIVRAGRNWPLALAVERRLIAAGDDRFCERFGKPAHVELGLGPGPASESLQSRTPASPRPGR
jgi:hypothetical protein